VRKWGLRRDNSTCESLLIGEPPPPPLNLPAHLAADPHALVALALVKALAKHLLGSLRGSGRGAKGKNVPN
jgi:hypothetical protein